MITINKSMTFETCEDCKHFKQLYSKQKNGRTKTEPCGMCQRWNKTTPTTADKLRCICFEQKQALTDAEMQQLNILLNKLNIKGLKK